MSTAQEIKEFMKTYNLTKDEVWQVHGKNWVVLHKALERIASQVGIVFDRPAMLETNSAEGIVALVVFGKLGDRTEWSIGEAHPKNNKNAYCYAMAEKRAKDRVILKLLNVSAYSEEEADDFKRENPHVTRPADIVPPADYDENGVIIDNIPHAEPTQKLRVVDQRPIFEALQKELHAFTDYDRALTWMGTESTIDRVKNLKADWQEIFRGMCKETLMSLRETKPKDMRMAG
jgi:hypothetical protein